MSAQLFDRSKAIEPGPFPLGSRAFELIERSSSPAHELARSRIEKMLTNYPASEVETLLTRLRAREASQANDAFFEIFVLHLFLEQGFKLIGIEQPLPHTAYVVDFTLEAPDGRPFLVEVVSFNPPRESVGAQKLVEEVYNAVDSIDSEFFQVEVRDVTGVPAQSVPKRAFKAKVSRWLQTLDKDKLHEGAEHFAVVTGFIMTLVPRLRDPEGRAGLLVGAPASTYVHNVVEGIRRKLYQKAYKYGPLEVPLVIALNVAPEIGATLEMFDEAVYGAASPDAVVDEPVEYTGEYVPAAGAMLEAAGPLSKIPAVLGFLGVNPFNVALTSGAVYCGKVAPAFPLEALPLPTFFAPGTAGAPT